jgi:putative hydrolase of the HAD superfamily
VFVGDGADGELAGAAAVGMTVFRTTEHNDTDPRWDGSVFAALGDLPVLLREPDSECRVGNPAGGARR